MKVGNPTTSSGAEKNGTGKNAAAKAPGRDSKSDRTVNGSRSEKLRRHAPGTRADRAQRSREQLLKAAVKVIRKRGYFNFTMVEAAAIAGQSRGGPTHHFKSTDNFLLAAMEYMFEQYLGKISYNDGAR